MWGEQSCLSLKTGWPQPVTVAYHRCLLLSAEVAGWPQPIAVAYHCCLLQCIVALIVVMLFVCSEEFASVVRLPVRDILDVICRVLAVTPKMLVGIT